MESLLWGKSPSLQAADSGEEERAIAKERNKKDKGKTSERSKLDDNFDLFIFFGDNEMKCQSTNIKILSTGT